MKKSTIFLCVVLFNAFIVTNLSSIDFVLDKNINVAKKPIAIFYDEFKDLFHIFCYGNDVNYNGIINPEMNDEPPTWWTLKISENEYIVDKVFEFTNGYFPFPFRPAMKFSNEPGKSRAYIPFTNETDDSWNIVKKGRICVYDLDSYTMIDDTSSALNLSAMAISYFDDELYISVREESGSSFIYVYDINQNQVIKQFNAGINVQQTLPFKTKEDEVYLSILNEGAFGQQNSDLQLISITDAIETKFFNLGDLGNHLNFNSKYLIATINGSHKVLVFDVEQWELAYEINTETTGFDGPREAHFFDDDYIFVSTYDFQIKIYSLWHSGELFNYLNTHGKPEGMDFRKKTHLVVANFINSDYSPDSCVSVFVNQESSVDNKNNKENLVIYPNPINSIGFIDLYSDLLGNNSTLKIYNSLGNCLFESQLDVTDCKFIINKEKMGLSMGCYYILISNNLKSEMSKFIINE